MYSRNYTDDDRPLYIPEHYDGTALVEPQCEQIRPNTAETVSREVKISPHFAEPPPEPEESAKKENGTDIYRLPIFLRKIFSYDLGFGLPKLGTEELLIGAVALCVIFSDEADILCALMLLLLIFIT